MAKQRKKQLSEHAPFAPSSAVRWLVCPGSHTLEAKAPDRPSEAAEIGTAAHTLAEMCLKGRNIDPSSVPHVGKIEVDDEMAEAVKGYVAAVRGLAKTYFTDVKIEARVILSEDVYGTIDALLISLDNETMIIIDLKYGKSIVKVDENPQLHTYAVAAIDEFGMPTERLILGVYQPRIGREDPLETITYTERGIGKMYKAWKIKIAMAVRRAKDMPNMFEKGSHCRYCKGKGDCPEFKAVLAQELGIEPVKVKGPVSPEKLSEADLAKFLEMEPAVQKYIKDVKAEAEARIKAGKKIPGKKLVYKVSNRQWMDEEKTKAALWPTLLEKMYVKKLVSPAQAEEAGIKKEVVKKLTGRTTKKELALVDEDANGIEYEPQSKLFDEITDDSW
jgi:hypothetical protein